MLPLPKLPHFKQTVVAQFYIPVCLEQTYPDRYHLASTSTFKSKNSGFI